MIPYLLYYYFYLNLDLSSIIMSCNHMKSFKSEFGLDSYETINGFFVHNPNISAYHQVSSYLDYGSSLSDLNLAFID